MSAIGVTEASKGLKDFKDIGTIFIRGDLSQFEPSNGDLVQKSHPESGRMITLYKDLFLGATWLTVKGVDIPREIQSICNASDNLVARALLTFTRSKSANCFLAFR